jgi:signal transduction histidine kinase
LRGEARAGETDDEAKGGLDDVVAFLSDNYLYHVNAAADALEHLKRHRMLLDKAIELNVFLAAVRAESNAFERTMEDAKERVENPELVSGLSIKDRYALYGDMTEYALARMRTPFAKGRDAAEGLASVDESDEAGQACRTAVDLAESARVFVEATRDLFKGKPKVERAKRPLGAVVERYLAQTAHYAAASGLSLRKKITTDAAVEIDESRMYQAFWQIARNAAQATPGGGALYVAAKTSEDRAIVSFKDDGFGMSEETRARLFEPFYSYGGGAAGLGVPLARFLVKEAGGEIAVSGAPSEGTLVEFSLPLADDGE